MSAPAFHLIGTGVYSLPEASRLIKVPRKRIRRWMEGYSFKYGGDRYSSDPVIISAIGREAGQLALTFLDLIEIRFLDAFLQHGVSMRTIRVASVRARDLLGRTHPFSAQMFKTDGRSILAEVARGGKKGIPELLNLVKDQWEFQKVVSPMLYAGLQFNDYAEPERWWPMTTKKLVVIDPTRSFGAPIAEGVRTQVLAASAHAEGSPRLTSQLYGVSPRAVKHAVQFEAFLLQ